MARYATVAELKGWLDVAGAAQDANLGLALSAAEDSIDQWCNRRFDLSATATARYYTASPGFVDVDDIGSSTGLVVASDSGTDGVYETTWTVEALTGYGFSLDPVNADSKGRPWVRLVASSSSFPTRRRGVKVTAKWGWPVVPGDIKTATLIKAGRIWKRKDTPFGIFGTVDTGFTRLGGEDQDVKTILGPYRKLMLG